VTDIEISTEDSLKVEDDLKSAVMEIEAGNYDDAYTLLLKTLRISKQYNFREGKAKSYLLLAEFWKSRRNYPNSLRNYFSAYREYEWLDDRKAMADILLNIGQFYKRVFLNRKALEYFLTADSLHTIVGSYNPSIKNLIGDTYLDLQEYEEALSYYLPLKLDYKNRSLKEQVLALNSKILISYTESGNFNNAKRIIEESLEIYQDIADTSGIILGLNNLGYNYKYLGDYESADKFLTKSLELSEEFANPYQLNVILVNLGVINQNMGNIDEAIQYLERAYQIASDEELHTKAAEAAHLLSLIYSGREDYYNAEIYNKIALDHGYRSPDLQLRSDILLASSKINTALYDYEMALQNYQDYLKYRDSAYIQRREVQDEILQQEFLAERYEREISSLVTDEELRESRNRELILDTIKKKQQIELQAKTIELQDAELQNRGLEKIQLEQEKLLAEERLASEIRDREILELKIYQQVQQDSLRQAEYNIKVAEAENEVLKAETELQNETIRRIKARNIFLGGIFLLALVILVIVYIGLRYAKKTNRLLTDQRNKIQQQKDAIQSQYEIIDRERERSDKLLLNILPAETAEELKETGKATPKRYEKVSVLFTDFKGFTNIAVRLSPEEVVKELDRCFLEFDRIADRHNLEKIKTIGDAYMCAGGLPVANETNPVDTVAAALEIRDFMEKERRSRMEMGKPYWELRIGINTGPVVAGVVGKNKFAYDIWGDTVNTASRMESSGEPGKVNISGETYELIKDNFKCIHRGKILAKNKGEIDMYFVERRL